LCLKEYLYISRKPTIMNHWTETRAFKGFLVLITLAFNIGFHIPMGGISAFMQLWGDGVEWLAVILQLILLYALSGSLYFFIKNV